MCCLTFCFCVAPLVLHVCFASLLPCASQCSPTRCQSSTSACCPYVPLQCCTCCFAPILSLCCLCGVLVLPVWCPSRVLSPSAAQEWLRKSTKTPAAGSSIRASTGCLQASPCIVGAIRDMVLDATCARRLYRSGLRGLTACCPCLAIVAVVCCPWGPPFRLLCCPCVAPCPAPVFANLSAVLQLGALSALCSVLTPCCPCVGSSFHFVLPLCCCVCCVVPDSPLCCPCVATLLPQSGSVADCCSGVVVQVWQPAALSSAGMCP